MMGAAKSACLLGFQIIGDNCPYLVTYNCLLTPAPDVTILSPSLTLTYKWLSQASQTRAHTHTHTLTQESGRSVCTLTHTHM